IASRQISSAVLITFTGDAPAPVSARLIPIRTGLPLCAVAPESKPTPIISAAPRVRSALQQRSTIVSCDMALLSRAAVVRAGACQSHDLVHRAPELSSRIV